MFFMKKRQATRKLYQTITEIRRIKGHDIDGMASQLRMSASTEDERNVFQIRNIAETQTIWLVKVTWKADHSGHWEIVKIDTEDSEEACEAYQDGSYEMLVKIRATEPIDTWYQKIKKS